MKNKSSKLLVKIFLCLMLFLSALYAYLSYYFKDSIVIAEESNSPVEIEVTNEEITDGINNLLINKFNYSNFETNYLLNDEKHNIKLDNNKIQIYDNDNNVKEYTLNETLTNVYSCYIKSLDSNIIFIITVSGKLYSFYVGNELNTEPLLINNKIIVKSVVSENLNLLDPTSESMEYYVLGSDDEIYKIGYDLDGYFVVNDSKYNDNKSLYMDSLFLLKEDYNYYSIGISNDGRIIFDTGLENTGEIHNILHTVTNEKYETLYFKKVIFNKIDDMYYGYGVSTNNRIYSFLIDDINSNEFVVSRELSNKEVSILKYKKNTQTNAYSVDIIYKDESKDTIDNICGSLNTLVDMS